LPFQLRVAKARHGLHNSIGQILGFAEMLLEETQEQGHVNLRGGLELILRKASQMVGQINDSLDAPKIESGLVDLRQLQKRVSEHSIQIVTATESLARKSRAPRNGDFKSDLARIVGGARQTLELARTALPALSAPAANAAARAEGMAKRLVESVPVGKPVSIAIETEREGVILVVDDLEENRELLSRRLSRLGYSVQLAHSGRRALEFVAANAVDLVLLDIMMPELDGFEALQRLKANPTTQHIPVIMLSSADQLDTVVRCIKLGADDFLPKPFNPTLLMARIESSLSKKRLRDKESAFLRRLQAEQDTSERLLLNILPKPIAERLKNGEKVIGDSFPEATVLFSDFVGFTQLSTRIAPKDLVAKLNEVFSAFDQLCEQHGLEKIKMIGDAYMVVGGVPTPRDDHAEAVAEMALAMQREVTRFSAAEGQPLRMRIGFNTGPVIAGVIGTKKFAYDLWGDTVNVANRMESHAPPGGILVTASTYARLRHRYSFKPGRVIRVKGKGGVLSYELLGRASGK
jgi:class 3 adenylate cyclase